MDHYTDHRFYSAFVRESCFISTIAAKLLQQTQVMLLYPSDDVIAGGSGEDEVIQYLWLL